MATFLVTGANRGIGFELCRQIKSRGDEVIAACRKSSAQLDRLGVRVEPGVDVTDRRTVDDLVRQLGSTSIDVLINNAGILERDSLEQLDLDAIRRQFDVNSLGPLRVTRAMLDNLREGSKIVIMTSLMGSLGDNSSGGHYGYRMSKAAASMAAVSMAHDLRHRGIAVAILHPGMVATEMTGNRGVSTEQSARGLLERVDALTLETSGTFWHANGSVLPW